MLTFITGWIIISIVYGVLLAFLKTIKISFDLNKYLEQRNFIKKDKEYISYYKNQYAINMEIKLLIDKAIPGEPIDVVLAKKVL